MTARLARAGTIGPAPARQRIAIRCQCGKRRRPLTPYVWGRRPPVRPSEEPRWPGAHQRRWAREVSRKRGDGPPRDAASQGPPPARQASQRRTQHRPGAHQRRWAREVSAPGRCRRRHRRGQERRGLVVVVVSDESTRADVLRACVLVAEGEGEGSRSRSGGLRNRIAAPEGSGGHATPPSPAITSLRPAGARQAGVPVEGICLYPVTDYPGWGTRGTARQDCSATSKLTVGVPCMRRLPMKSRLNSARGERAGMNPSACASNSGLPLAS